MKKVSTSLFHTSIYLHGWGSGLYFCGQFVIDIHFQVSINPRLHTGWILPLYFGTSFHITLIFCIRSDKVLTFFRSWKLRSSLKHIPSLWLCLHNIMLLKWTLRAWLSFLCSGIRCHLKCPGVPWGTQGIPMGGQLWQMVFKRLTPSWRRLVEYPRASPEVLNAIYGYLSQACANLICVLSATVLIGCCKDLESFGSRVIQLPNCLFYKKQFKIEIQNSSNWGSPLLLLIFWLN